VGHADSSQNSFLPRSTSAELGDMKVEHAPTDSTGYVQFKNVAKEREEEEKKKQEVSVLGLLLRSEGLHPDLSCSP
jgi:hypothetical protein